MKFKIFKTKHFSGLQTDGRDHTQHSLTVWSQLNYQEARTQRTGSQVLGLRQCLLVESEPGRKRSFL